ncbi:hypothetical protein Ancab_014792, partial [Ancistrocladus abbreviatus]
LAVDVGLGTLGLQQRKVVCYRWGVSRGVLFWFEGLMCGWLCADAVFVDVCI